MPAELDARAKILSELERLARDGLLSTRRYFERLKEAPLDAHNDHRWLEQVGEYAKQLSPDWQHLRRAASEVARLAEQGTLTPLAFDVLHEQARIAVDGRTELLELFPKFVRPYMAADAAACCETINAAVEVMDGLNDEARELIRAKNVTDVLGPELEAAYTLVVESERRVLAVGCLSEGEIKRLYVDPSVQRAGVGRALVAAFEEEATRQCRKSIHVDASPSSVGFYERLGFTALREDTLTRGAATFLFVIMTKELVSDTSSEPGRWRHVSHHDRRCHAPPASVPLALANVSFRSHAKSRQPFSPRQATF